VRVTVARVVFTDSLFHFSSSISSGILHTAQKKLELLEPFLIEALRAHPDYGLVIVGHSLGAGAASLLTILLHNSAHRLTVNHFIIYFILFICSYLYILLLSIL
jgi:hypothetical protein